LNIDFDHLPDSTFKLINKKYYESAADTAYSYYNEGEWGFFDAMQITLCKAKTIRLIRKKNLRIEDITYLTNYLYSNLGKDINGEGEFSEHDNFILNQPKNSIYAPWSGRIWRMFGTPMKTIMLTYDSDKRVVELHVIGLNL